MAESNTEDMSQFLGMDTTLSLDDYLANGLSCNVNDEMWKDLSDGSDSGIDGTYAEIILLFLHCDFLLIHHFFSKVYCLS